MENRNCRNADGYWNCTELSFIILKTSHNFETCYLLEKSCSLLLRAVEILAEKQQWKDSERVKSHWKK